MIWFGSSAGVAISNMYPQAKSVGLWLRHGWFVVVAYVVGFFVMLAIVGWNPDAPHKKRAAHDTGHQLAQTFPFERSQPIQRIGRQESAFRGGLLVANVEGDGDAYA